VAVLGLMAGAVGQARADLAINTPNGLQPGEQFRIAFVTDATTTATNTSIDYYNQFVNTDARNEAGGGNVTYDGIKLAFTAIASTEGGYSAYTNTGSGTGAAVYLSNGIEVAPTDLRLSQLPAGQTSCLFLPPHPIDTDLLGNVKSSYVWTGTYYYSGGAYTRNTLGDEYPVVGLSSAITTDAFIAATNSTEYFYSSLPLYGISQVLTVPGGVAAPEPSTLVLGAIGSAAFAVYGWYRQRREHRRRTAA
jgi:hypothetical protein